MFDYMAKEFFFLQEQSPGVLPIMAYTGRLLTKGVPFSGFRYENVGISLVEVCEGKRKSVILVCKKYLKG